MSQHYFPDSLFTALAVCLLLAVMLSTCAGPACAHDTWVEANTAVVRAGDAVFLDLKLGNHGNDHRDFKLAGKIDLADSSLTVLLPNGAKLDMLDRLQDVGYSPNEGYWTGKFVTTSAGTYVVWHQLDKIVNHGRPIRSIKSAKCFFLVGTELDHLQDESNLWKQPVGHPLEIVLLSHPVLLTGPGVPIEVQVLRNGIPKAAARVSFIPQGVTLAEGFDETYERNTNADGIASFKARTGTRLLIVTHERAENEKSAEYDLTSYSATLQMIVPDICPCCR